MRDHGTEGVRCELDFSRSETGLPIPFTPSHRTPTVQSIAFTAAKDEIVGRFGLRRTILGRNSRFDDDLTQLTIGGGSSKPTSAVFGSFRPCYRLPESAGLAIAIDACQKPAIDQRPGIIRPAFVS